MQNEYCDITGLFSEAENLRLISKYIYSGNNIDIYRFAN